MADNAGRRTTGMVSSSPAPPGPLPSPGTSRRNSPSDEKFVRVPSIQQIYQPPPQSASPALPVTTPGFVHPPPAHYRHQPPPPQQGSNAQFMRAPVSMPASSVPASHPMRHGNSAHPSAQQAEVQAPQAPPGSRAIVFPSPISNGAPLCISQQYENLMRQLRQTEPHVVRQVIRDSHETSLLGSEYHHIFLLNTAIHKAQASSLSQAISDYGSRLVQTSKRQLVAHFTANDFDEVADDILGKVSNDFLDRALAKRLETIRARSLVNILAQAERLGYNVKDIVEETRGGAEHVIPYLQQDLAQRPPQRPPQHEQQQQQQPSVPPVQAESVRLVPSATKAKKDDNPVDRFQRCSDCYRPLSGPQALHYHRLKKACHNFKTFDRVGKDLCAHCGAEFTSSGGLSYHVKSQVCGAYTDSHVAIIMPALEQFYRERAPAPAPSTQVGGLSRLAQRPHQDLQSVNVTIVPVATSHTSTPPGKKGDPFAHLSPEDRKKLETELARAEAHYGTLMQKAMELASPAREDELAKLKNSFNTKQCMTRKKYGVRLRERRTKAELEAEQQRLYTNAEAKPHVRFQPPVATHSPSPAHRPVTTQPPVSTHTEPVPAVKRARINEEGDSAPTSQPNIPKPSDDSPRKRVALADMGGLGTSAATAEHTDPTAVTPTHPQSMNTSEHKVAERFTDTRQNEARMDPMDIGDSDSSDTDSEGDDGDIPAVLQAGGQK